MHLLIKIFAAAFCLLIGHSLFSQEYQFRNFTADDGLISSQVTTIMQDSKGLMWFGTRAGGLSSFNSKEFKNYTKEEGLLDNQINAISENPSTNEIWVGTSKGISIISNSIVPKNMDAALGLTSEFITALCYSPENEVMFMGTDKGMFMYRNDTITPLRTETDQEFDVVKNIYRTREGTIIVSGEQNTWTVKGNTLIAYNPVLTNLESGKISFLYEDNDGGLWFSSDSGLIRHYNNKDFVYTESTGLTYPSVSGIAEDFLGNYWVALDIGGINKLKINSKGAASFKYIGTENGIANTRVYTAFTDREGNLWFGTDAGVSRLSDQHFISYTTANGLPNNYINGIMEDSKGQFWIATAGGGVTVFKNDVALKNIHSKNGDLLSPYVLVTLEDKNGNIWLGTWGGYVSVFDGENFRHITDKEGMTVDKVYSLAEDRARDIMYIGLVNGGVGVYRNHMLEKIITIDDGLISNVVYAMYMDSQNRLWIGTKEGVSVYQNEIFTNYSKDNGLIDNNITDIYEDRQGNIWISGELGVNRFDGTAFTHYTKKHGVSNASFCLEDNEGNVWVGTSRGLTKISFGSDGEERFHMISTDNGLVGSETIVHSKLKDSSGHLWFGTTQGLSKYIPENNFSSNERPLLFIDKVVTINNTVINPGDKVDYDNRNIVFHYTGVWFKDDIGLEYSYQLEGFDKGWSSGNFGENNVRYTNLIPGEYTFKVKAKNSLGVWSKQKQFSFAIVPPFWQTWWFYSLITASLLFIIYVVYKIKVRNMMEQKRRLEGLVSERTTEVVRQKEEINMQMEVLEQKNKDITDSLNYAKKIQDALLPFPERVANAIPEHFILYKPKDIVSGDFYWFVEKNEKIFLAVVDCTGHGVPGAFMSMIGSAILSHIVGEQNITRADLILNEMHKQVRTALKQQDTQNKDGMDLVLCVIDKNRRKLEFVGAMNPLYLVKNGTLEIIKGDKSAIGGSQDEVERKFTLHTVDLKEEVCIYLFTDGYADQFGGPKGKKFKYAQFKELLVANGDKPMKEQREILDITIEEWKGDLEQVDDVCVIGVRL